MIKKLNIYLFGVLCLLCIAGPGRVGAVDTIQYDWAFGQLYTNGGIQQVIVGWGLDTTGLTATSSIMNSFQNVKGAMAIGQITGNLNNSVTGVNIDFGTPSGANLVNSPLFTSSIISDNVLRNYSSTYNTVIGGHSFEASKGILAVTQIAGNMNNIANVVGFSTGGAKAVSLSNATLSDVNASNNVYQNLGVTHASSQIQSDSFKGFSGVGSVVQASGNMIQISSHLNVRVNP